MKVCSIVSLLKYDSQENLASFKGGQALYIFNLRQAVFAKEALAKAEAI